ncbi:MAG: hypothetical protein AB1497_01425 [Bacillota bacterium]
MTDRGFFPLEKKYAAALITYIALAVVFFLPWARQHSVYGVSLFGWLMGAFMFVAPLINLLLLRSDNTGK